jgi:TolB-like protein/tRNA A-37 threonylcarbamoyl transferase component Bud32
MDLRTQLQHTLTGTHTVERELGGGGMSRVFVAEETRLRRKVVIKVLSPELAQGLSLDRFEREIQLAASLQQANIVPVLSAGDTDGLPWFAMPFVEGESLRQRLATGPLPIAEVVGILRDVSRALSYAHKRGIVHRDIKPDNVLVSAGAAVVTDFGIAKAISAARTQGDATMLTQTGTSIGTPAYMSPEQAAGDPDIDARADIYALGCMAYELLAGQPPFSGQSAQRIIAAHLTGTPRPVAELRPEVPPALANLVMRCLEKRPADRPQSADEVAQALDGITVSGSGPSASAQRGSPRLIYGIVATAAVLAAVVLWLMRRPGSGAATDAPRSLAVLPIVNAGGDSAKEYLADGMTSELAGNLRQTPGLTVVGDLSTFRFKHSSAPPAEIAKELGVGMLLTGTLQSQGSSIRLQMQLNDAAGKLLWSSSFDRQMKDNFALQDEVTAAIAREMRVVLSPAMAVVARAGRTENAEAHDLYLHGMFEKNKLTEQGLLHAVSYFKQAIALDSSYAQGYAGLSFAYDMLADAYRPSHEYHLLAKDAADRAIRSDSMLADAHVMLGFELGAAHWDIPAAMREMQRGLALDPNSPDALFMYGAFLGITGQTDSAVAVAERLIRVDPLSAMASAAKVIALSFGGRWAEALRQDSVTKKLDPSVVYADAWDAAALRELGHLPESVAAYKVYQTLIGGQPSFGLAITYGRLGKRDDALAIIRQLEAARRTSWVDPDFIAADYIAIGDHDHAMQWLETAFQEKSWTLRFFIETKVGWFDGIAADPRFIALKQKVRATTFQE